MADVTLISEKGSALSCEELDNNFKVIREVASEVKDIGNRTIERYPTFTYSGAGDPSLLNLFIFNEKIKDVLDEMPQGKKILFHIFITASFIAIEDDGNGKPKIADDGKYSIDSKLAHDLLEVTANKTDKGVTGIDFKSVGTGELGQLAFFQDYKLACINLATNIEDCYDSIAQINLTVKPARNFNAMDYIEIFPADIEY